MNLKVLPITPEIAALAQDPRFTHGDPADRLIAATALAHEAARISADSRLAPVPGLRCIYLVSKDKIAPLPPLRDAGARVRDRRAYRFWGGAADVRACRQRPFHGEHFVHVRPDRRVKRLQDRQR